MTPVRLIRTREGFSLHVGEASFELAPRPFGQAWLLQAAREHGRSPDFWMRWLVEGVQQLHGQARASEFMEAWYLASHFCTSWRSPGAAHFGAESPVCPPVIGPALLLFLAERDHAQVFIAGVKAAGLLANPAYGGRQ